MNIQPISEPIRQQMNFAVVTCNDEALEQITAKVWKQNLPDNGNQLTCSRRFIEGIFGYFLTESLIEAGIFEYFGGANDQIVRRF